MSDRSLIGFSYNDQLAGAGKLVESLVVGLDLKGRSWSSSAAMVSEVEDRLDRTSLVVVVGGDGTILRRAGVRAPEIAERSITPLERRFQAFFLNPATPL